MTIRLLLVDDEDLVRFGLRTILDLSDDIDVVGEASDGAEAVSAARGLHPEVVLMDVRMPRVDGLAATRQILDQPDPPKVVILTTFHLDEYVFSALQAGASGFLLKDTPPRQIVAAIRAVAAGSEMLSPAVTRRLIAEYVAPRDHPQRTESRRRMATLSDRERDVLTLIGKGLSNAEAAQHLFMSEATIKTYVSRMLTKLELANRTQAAILAYEAGLYD
ncbi:MAG TPA: response regulator transcription factor [Mycobacterium sp.]